MRDGWIAELIQCGEIIQDSDFHRFPDGEPERRSKRYVALLDEVKGTENQATFHAVLDSIHAGEDYGVYETTYNTLWRFPKAQAGKWLGLALPGLLKRLGTRWEEQASRMLYPVGSPGDANRAFLEAAHQWKAPERQRVIADFRRWSVDNPTWEPLIKALGGRAIKPAGNSAEAEAAPEDWPKPWAKFLADWRSKKRLAIDAWKGSPEKQLDLVIALLTLNPGPQWRDIDPLTNPLFFYAKKFYPAFLKRVRALPVAKREVLLANLKRASPRKYVLVKKDL